LKKKREEQFPINQKLKDEIGKKNKFNKESRKNSKSTNVNIQNL
jgi:hypothetical protein